MTSALQTRTELPDDNALAEVLNLPDEVIQQVNRGTRQAAAIRASALMDTVYKRAQSGRMEDKDLLKSLEINLKVAGLGDEKSSPHAGLATVHITFTGGVFSAGAPGGASMSVVDVQATEVEDPAELDKLLTESIATPFRAPRERSLDPLAFLKDIPGVQP